MDSFTRFDETKLPSQEEFFSELSVSPCSDFENTHATGVWAAFECKTIADYHYIYFWQNFLGKVNETCLEYYSLDPIHYYTTPCLAWDAGLGLSLVDLGLITDVDIYHFIENTIQGGISMIPTHHAQANDPTFPRNDARLPNLNLIYLDANNLYGWAMSQLLPTRGFHFLQQDEIDVLKVVGAIQSSPEWVHILSGSSLSNSYTQSS